MTGTERPVTIRQRMARWSRRRYEQGIGTKQRFEMRPSIIPVLLVAALLAAFFILTIIALGVS